MLEISECRKLLSDKANDSLSDEEVEKIAMQAQDLVEIIFKSKLSGAEDDYIEGL